jgi:hypothetical protein
MPKVIRKVDAPLGARHRKSTNDIAAYNRIASGTSWAVTQTKLHQTAQNTAQNIVIPCPL